MGAYHSTNHEYERAIQCFNEAEQAQIRKTFSKICHGGKWLSKDNLRVRSTSLIFKILVITSNIRYISNGYSSKYTVSYYIFVNYNSEFKFELRLDQRPSQGPTSHNLRD